MYWLEEEIIIIPYKTPHSSSHDMTYTYTREYVTIASVRHLNKVETATATHACYILCVWYSPYALSMCVLGVLVTYAARRIFVIFPSTWSNLNASKKKQTSPFFTFMYLLMRLPSLLVIYLIQMMLKVNCL